MKNAKLDHRKKLLDVLNRTYAKLHTTYENYFWDVYMGNRAVQEEMNRAQNKRDEFRSNREMLDKVNEALLGATGKDKENLEAWKLFFGKYQTPKELALLKERINELESEIYKKRTHREEGYIDPYTREFVPASINTLRNMVNIDDDEKVRKAAYEGSEKLATHCIDEYIILVGLRNEYARALGFTDFYAYKAYTEEGMTKEDIFGLFGSVYEKTKYVFDDIRALEKTIPKLRAPWNFGYMMSGDFTKEEDPYFQFQDALLRFGRSFSALGIDYQGGTIQLDLLDRKGKHNNGFCHWPKLVEYRDGERLSGSSNFTCNVVVGKPGEGNSSMRTLFHEGGHAAHLLNSTQTQVCFNHEYPPSSMAWDETQSMFLDSMFASIEWKMRYAQNRDGKTYPFDLYERKLKKLHVLTPSRIMSIMLVSEFEKSVYECKNLTPDKVISFAKKMHKKYMDRSVSSLWVLNAMHIYGWESSCSYHGYGLADMAVEQWREYFYKKYGYIVDNPRVGKEMREVWKLGSSKTFKEFVKRATGKELSAGSYIKNVTRTVSKALRESQKKIERMKQVPKYTKPVKLNAVIKLVHGTEMIATNKKSFEDMAEKYARWLDKQA